VDGASGEVVTGKRKREKVTLQDAFDQGRCTCEGCVVCMGQPDKPCGQGGINEQPMCRWCTKVAMGGLRVRSDEYSSKGYGRNRGYTLSSEDPW
jgi:hypothetical protein